MDLEAGMAYVLDKSGDPVLEEDTDVWLEFLLNNKVIRHSIPRCGGLVSTVFLGIATWEGSLFETKVFNILFYAGMCRRYRTRAEAVDGHEEVLAIIENDPNLK